MNGTSYVYVGLAGETAPGRPVQSGLYRMVSGDEGWELVTRGLPEAPAIRAIATHPEHRRMLIDQPELIDETADAARVWRNAMFVVFAACGFALAAWVSRTPEIGRAHV